MLIKYELLLIIMFQYLCTDSDNNLVTSEVNNRRTECGPMRHMGICNSLSNNFPVNLKLF